MITCVVGIASPRSHATLHPHYHAGLNKSCFEPIYTPTHTEQLGMFKSKLRICTTWRNLATIGGHHPMVRPPFPAIQVTRTEAILNRTPCSVLRDSPSSVHIGTSTTFYHRYLKHASEGIVSTG